MRGRRCGAAARRSPPCRSSGGSCPAARRAPGTGKLSRCAARPWRSNDDCGSTQSTPSRSTTARIASGKPGSDPGGTRWNASHRCRPTARSDMSVPTSRTSRSPFERSAAQERRRSGCARRGDEHGDRSQASHRATSVPVLFEPARCWRASSGRSSASHISRQPGRARRRPQTRWPRTRAGLRARSASSSAQRAARRRAHRRRTERAGARRRRSVGTPHASPASSSRSGNPVVRRRGRDRGDATPARPGPSR